MSAVLLDGHALAAGIAKSLAPRVAAIAKARGRPPRLAVVAVGPDPAAESYLHAQLKACRAWGLESEVPPLSAWAGQAEILKLLGALAADDKTDGIIVDLPLPKRVSLEAVLAALPSGKDAEGVCPASFGRLMHAKSYGELHERGLVAPPTALAVAELLRETKVPLSGKRAAVLGRSTIVGRPAAQLLSMLDLTVTLCHSKTVDLEGEVRRADVVVACMGKAGSVPGSWIKPGAVVIDAGINQKGGRIVGDVDASGAAAAAAYLTPVPGGVGPVTTAMLLANTVALAEARLKL